MSDTLNWSTTAPRSALAAGNRDSEQPDAGDGHDAHDALATGTRLDEFAIVRVLGAGGFGIVYLALDTVLQRQVAIKEYMPTALAGRRGAAMVSVRSPTHADTFAVGLESFFSEARMLASFDHPSLVKVHRVWKANGTAYMVMPYCAGQTLKEARQAMRAAPDERWLHALIEPLLGALEVLHRDGVYHRDISPDNILLLPDGRPVLLDFGSARRVVGDRTQSLTAILKPNFAPVEQYADQADLRQGPWTDLYSLGATVHFMLTGQAPTPAVLRAVRDGLPALSVEGGEVFPGVPMRFLATIDWTLALAPDDRPQSVAVVRQAFSGELVPPPPSARHSANQPAAAAGNTGHATTHATTHASTASAQSFAKTAWEANGSAGRSTTGADIALPFSSPGTTRRAAWAALALAGLSAVAWGVWTAVQPAAVAVATTTPEALSTAASAAAPVLVAAPASAPASPPASASAPPPALAIIQPAAAVPPAVAASTAALVASPRLPLRVAAVPPSQAAAASGASAVRLLLPPAASVDIKPQRSARATAVEAVPAVPTAPDATRSPSEFCGGQSFFARAMCVNRECQTPRWRAHPECVAARQAEDQRQQRMNRY